MIVTICGCDVVRYIISVVGSTSIQFLRVSSFRCYDRLILYSFCSSFHKNKQLSMKLKWTYGDSNGWQSVLGRVDIRIRISSFVTIGMKYTRCNDTRLKEHPKMRSPSRRKRKKWRLRRKQSNRNRDNSKHQQRRQRRRRVLKQVLLQHVVRPRRRTILATRRNAKRFRRSPLHLRLSVRRVMIVVATKMLSTRRIRKLLLLLLFLFLLLLRREHHWCRWQQWRRWHHKFYHNRVII